MKPTADAAASVRPAARIVETVEAEFLGRCPLCGADTRVTRYAGLRDLWVGSPGAWDLQQCTCGLLYLDPRPTALDLPRVYAEYYTHRAAGCPGAAEEREERLVLRRLHRAALAPLAPLKHRVTTMYLDHRTPGTLLDVGCGNGQLLTELRKLGWDVRGVEVDARAVRVAREEHGLEVHEGPLTTAGFAPDTFDVVTLNHVIEHLYDPIGTLVECRRVLKPDGSLVVMTPNAASFGHRWFGRAWSELDPPRHAFVFDRTTLGALATRAGFSRLRTTTTAARGDETSFRSLGIRRAMRDGRVTPAVRGWGAWATVFLLVGMTLNLVARNLGDEVVLRARK